MAIHATNETKSSIKPLDPGTYISRCVEMVHIGTVLDEYEGREKQLNKVRIGWEIPDETIEIEKDDKKETIVRRVYQNFTLSLHEKAALRKLLDAWRGKSFTDAEAKSFDVSKLLGVPCMLSLGLNKKETYNTILGAAKMPKGIEAKPQHYDSKEINYENIDAEAWGDLPEFVRNDMKTTPEFKASGFVPPSTSAAETPTPTPPNIEPAAPIAPDESGDVGSVDDLPF